MSTHTFSLCGINRDNYWRKLDNLHFSVCVVDVTEQEAHVNAIFGMIRMLSASNLTLMVLLLGILNYCIAQVIRVMDPPRKSTTTTPTTTMFPTDSDVSGNFDFGTMFSSA